MCQGQVLSAFHILLPVSFGIINCFGILVFVDIYWKVFVDIHWKVFQVCKGQVLSIFHILLPVSEWVHSNVETWNANIANPFMQLDLNSLFDAVWNIKQYLLNRKKDDDDSGLQQWDWPAAAINTIFPILVLVPMTPPVNR